MMETKQIISWLRDKVDRAQNLSWTWMMHMAADRLWILENRQRWIPVTERLPDGDENCLVLTTVGHCVVAYHNNVLWRVLWDCSRLENEDVTHWMPLPEPPKEVE